MRRGKGFDPTFVFRLHFCHRHFATLAPCFLPRGREYYLGFLLLLTFSNYLLLLTPQNSEFFIKLILKTVLNSNFSQS
jgi:hypothetical protein